MYCSEEKLKEAMENLFSAKWNVPKAAEAMEMAANYENWEHTKQLFKEFCLKNPPTYNETV